MTGQDHYVFLAGSISGIMEGVTIQVGAGGHGRRPAGVCWFGRGPAPHMPAHQQQQKGSGRWLMLYQVR